MRLHQSPPWAAHRLDNLDDRELSAVIDTSIECSPRQSGSTDGDHLDTLEALQHLLPDNPKLQLGEPHADAAVNAGRACTFIIRVLLSSPYHAAVRTGRVSQP
jgi:hypothetical protein